MLLKGAAQWMGLSAIGIAVCLPEPAAAQSALPLVQLDGAYVSDLLANVSGGRETGFRAMGKLDILATLDGALIGLDGPTFYLDLQYIHGDSLSEELVGDAQIVSNIDALSALRPFEAYISVPVGSLERGTFKAGLIDLNGDFDVQEVGRLFLNSSHGIGPDFSQSGLNGPSIFPTTAMAFTLGWEGDRLGLRFGLFDGVAGDPENPKRTVVRFPGDTGLLLVAEADLDLGASAKLQVGGWGYTRRFDALNMFEPDGSPRQIGGNHGVYALIEGGIATWDDRSLDAWARIGMASDHINPISVYVGGGVTYGNDDRKLGFAVAHASLGDPAVRAAMLAGENVDRAETAFELTYSHSLSDRVTIHPDIQYVLNPGWNPSLRNALVFGVRFEVDLF